MLNELNSKTIRVEFHSHTYRSKDSLLKPTDLVAACIRKGVDKVVVTDHNSIQGAQEAQRLAPERVIVGEEIKTTSGELLAVFVKELIPGGLSPVEAIRRLREQGAFISVSHPFDAMRNGSWKREELDKIIDQVDAIEVFNARCWSSKENELALQYAIEHDKPGTAGSDAHTAMELGRAVLEIPAFQDAPGLLRVIKSAKVNGKLSPWWIHFTSRWAVWKKGLSQA